MQEVLQEVLAAGHAMEVTAPVVEPMREDKEEEEEEVGDGGGQDQGLLH